MARPTKYNSKILEIAKDYLTTFNSDGDVVPTIEGLALRLGISRETVYAWQKDENKAEFSDMVRALMATQAKLLVNMGLNSTFNPTITKLILTKHGYSDRIYEETKQVEPATINIISPYE